MKRAATWSRGMQASAAERHTVQYRTRVVYSYWHSAQGSETKSGSASERVGGSSVAAETAGQVGSEKKRCGALPGREVYLRIVSTWYSTGPGLVWKGAVAVILDSIIPVQYSGRGGGQAVPFGSWGCSPQPVCATCPDASVYP